MAKKQKYYQRPDGLFEAIRTINGKRKAFRGKSCREVDKKILEYQEKLERGRLFREVLNEWWSEKEPTISEATRISYRAPIRRLEKEYGDRPIKEIRPLDLERTMLHMKEVGYRRGTTYGEKTIIRQVFRWAVIHGDIDISPATEIRTPKGMPQVKRKILTDDQIRAITEYRGEGYLLGLVLLYTGCRIGEAMGLKYEDIDRNAGTITIQRKVSYANCTPVMEDHTKTEAGMRKIKLLSPLAEALPKNRIGLIFHKPDGGLMTQVRYTHLWRQLCDGVGLVEYEQVQRGKATFTVPKYPITPHCLRHTFATLCFDAGIDPKTTAEMLGHADEKTTRDIYTHLRQNRIAEDAEKLQEYVSGMVGTV